MNKDTSYELIVIGAGAAGLMAAISAASPQKKILVLESNKKALEKVRISGGGRCNFTNLNARAENYISENPHFCKSALAQYPVENFISLIKKHKINFFEKKLGQLFCESSSQEIIEMLLNEAKEKKVKIELQERSKKITQDASGFIVETDRSKYSTKKVIVASGGISIPKIGATDFAYRTAQAFGLALIEPRAALVPFITDLYTDLAGLSMDTVISCRSRYSKKPIAFRENLLFTHRGLSGPAVLQISSYFRLGEEISIDFCPEFDLADLLLKLKEQKINSSEFIQTEKDLHKRKLKNILLNLSLPEQIKEQQRNKIERKQIFSSSFVDFLAKQFDLEKTLAETPNKEILATSRFIQEHKIKIDSDEGFSKAEVTAGGIDTKELSSKNMEVKKVPGLYFIGEAVDVTGWLGGYNLQWAWASGFAAGTHAAS